MTADTSQYLENSEIIDFRQPSVAQLAAQLDCGDALATVARCYRFVRDEIKHSLDHELNPVTCSASEVLASGTGYCYAKSHLLCALLRANAIPAGLCYQRLSVNGDGSAFCLHGLNAVLLPDVGWFRVDARGNRDGISAEFTPPNEQLAFSPRLPGEYDILEIHAVPLPVVVESLRRYRTWDTLAANLPDDPDRVHNRSHHAGDFRSQN